MVKLTEEMVVARTRISDLTAIKKLNCWGTELTDVTILRHLKKVEVLSLSVNNIDTLADFEYCLNLQDLFVRKNNIKDLNQVCYLQNLPNLRNLWLGENPCSERDGYRMAVLRALPNLEKLDDKIVAPDEVQNALARGKILVHPSDMDSSPTRADTPNPQEMIDEYTDDGEDEERRRYSADRQQQPSYVARVGHRTIDDTYQETDRTNANWNASPNLQPNLQPNFQPNFQHSYPQNNHYGHEEYDEPAGETERTRRRRRHSSSNGEDSYEDNTRRSVFPHSDSGENDTNLSHLESTGTNEISTRTSYPPSNYSEERRSVDRRDVTYEQVHDDRRSTLFESDIAPKRNSAGHRPHHQRTNVDRDESCTRDKETAAAAAAQGWVRHSEDKCRFHYHRRPVTRNSNILSALLCLVKELDYPSLEVVEMAVRNRMDELEE